MRKRIWITGAAAVTVCLLIVAGAVAITASGDDSDAEDERSVADPVTRTERPTSGTQTGKRLSCSAGENVRAYYNQVAAEFLVIGELTEADGGHFTVDGPSGELAMTLAMESDVEGSYVIGEPIEVGGRRLSNGDLEATRVRPGCNLAVAAATTNPASVSPSGSGTPAPSGSQTPTATPVRTPIRVPVVPIITFLPAADEPPPPPPPEPTPEPVTVTEAPIAPPTEPPTLEPTAAPTEDPRPTRTAPPEEPS